MHHSNEAALAAEPEKLLDNECETLPATTPFERLQEQHRDFLQNMRFVGWRDSESRLESEYLTEFAEEFLRTSMPEFAAPDLENFGESRSKILLHNSLVRQRPLGRGEYQYEFQTLLEIRDKNGHWAILDSDGTPYTLRNAACMHIQGPDGSVQYLSVVYSGAALTEVLFNAENKISPPPAHLFEDLTRELGYRQGKKFPGKIELLNTANARFDWRKSEIQIETNHGNFIVHVGCEEGGSLSFRFYRADC
jgi:hypothetical protein